MLREGEELGLVDLAAEEESDLSDWTELIVAVEGPSPNGFTPLIGLYPPCVCVSEGGCPTLFKFLK